MNILKNNCELFVWTQESSCEFIHWKSWLYLGSVVLDTLSNNSTPSPAVKKQWRGAQLFASTQLPSVRVVLGSAGCKNSATWMQALTDWTLNPIHWLALEPISNTPCYWGWIEVSTFGTFCSNDGLAWRLAWGLKVHRICLSSGEMSDITLSLPKLRICYHTSLK